MKSNLSSSIEKKRKSSAISQSQNEQSRSHHGKSKLLDGKSKLLDGKSKLLNGQSKLHNGQSNPNNGSSISRDQQQKLPSESSKLHAQSSNTRPKQPKLHLAQSCNTQLQLFHKSSKVSSKTSNVCQEKPNLHNGEAKTLSFSLDVCLKHPNTNQTMYRYPIYGRVPDVDEGFMAVFNDTNTDISEQMVENGIMSLLIKFKERHGLTSFDTHKKLSEQNVENIVKELKRLLNDNEGVNEKRYLIQTTIYFLENGPYDKQDNNVSSSSSCNCRAMNEEQQLNIVSDIHDMKEIQSKANVCFSKFSDSLQSIAMLESILSNTTSTQQLFFALEHTYSLEKSMEDFQKAEATMIELKKMIQDHKEKFSQTIVDHAKKRFLENISNEN